MSQKQPRQKAPKAPKPPRLTPPQAAILDRLHRHNMSITLVRIDNQSELIYDDGVHVSYKSFRPLVKKGFLVPVSKNMAGEDYIWRVV